MRWIQTLLAVVAAVAPMLGVFLWGWSLQAVVLIYWIENVIIGFWQVVKMILAGVGKAKEEGTGTLPNALFMMCFFIVHYGGFCFGHGQFVLMLTSGGIAAEWTSLLEMPRESLLSVVSIFSLRGLGVWQDFVATGEWKRVKPGKLMVEPYRHIFVLHIAIVLGAGLVMAFEGAWPLLALIVLGKLVADLFQIWRGSRRKG